MPAHRFRRFTDVSDRTCAVLDCEKKPRSGRQDLCNMHYQRQWKTDKVCSVGGCDSPYLAKGMCGLHYKRAANGEEMHGPRKIALPGTPCIVDGCEGRRHSQGYCGKHYQRVFRTGDPDGFLKAPRAPVCIVDGCEGIHFGVGYCRGHYSRHVRGVSVDERPCQRCGQTFIRSLSKSGSYNYCAECQQIGFPYWAALRRERVTANNEGMMAEDKALALEYREIIAADPCVYCGQPGTAIDHIHPVMRGGSDRWDNLASTCTSCNSKKRARSVLDAMMFLEAARGSGAATGQGAGGCAA